MNWTWFYRLFVAGEVNGSGKVVVIIHFNEIVGCSRSSPVKNWFWTKIGDKNLTYFFFLSTLWPLFDFLMTLGITHDYSMYQKSRNPIKLPWKVIKGPKTETKMTLNMSEPLLSCRLFWFTAWLMTYPPEGSVTRLIW